MDVFLVPVGPARYALYCEAPATEASADHEKATSLWGRAVAAFRRAVAEGEEHARGSHQPDDRGKLRRLVTRKLSEAVAEQRLLWSLRNETTATLIHPDTLAPDRALSITRAEFASDYARHRRWAAIDALLTIITGPLFFFVPGPNVISWYFTFRTVGHYFSMRGARQGLSVVTFTLQPSAHLSEVAAAVDADAPDCHSRVAVAAEALGLDRLASFVERCRQ